MTTCKKCGGECKPSKVFENRLIGSEFEFNIQITSFIDVLKCVECGHSFVPERDRYKEYGDSCIGYLKP
jgi:hypothetical protein